MFCLFNARRLAILWCIYWKYDKIASPTPTEKSVRHKAIFLQLKWWPVWWPLWDWGIIGVFTRVHNVSFNNVIRHYSDDAMASQITDISIVHSAVYWGADQIKHQSSASLAFEWNSPVTSEFPAPRASNAENVSIWWRHRVCLSINVHRNVSNVVVITGSALGLAPQGDRPSVYSQRCPSISRQHIQNTLIRIALTWHHVSTWLLGHEGRSQYPLLRVGRPCSMGHNCAINWHSSWVGWFPQNDGRQGALNRDNTQWLSVHSIKLTVSQQFST